MDLLSRIKRLVASRQYRFSVKALHELDCDGLEPRDAIESVLNAQRIAKAIRSRSVRTARGDRLYVIESFNYGGILLYTKGKISQEAGQEIYYFFISAKASRYHE